MNNINEILDAHKKWLACEEGGSRANLCGADLRYVDLRGADLRGADLCGADLRYVDLRGADLRGVTIWDCVGNKDHIKSGQIDRYNFAYTSEYLQIGCERHAIEDWWGFSDERIERMDAGALEWWRMWKPILKTIIETSPATPTGREENSDGA